MIHISQCTPRPCISPCPPTPTSPPARWRRAAVSTIRSKSYSSSRAHTVSSTRGEIEPGVGIEPGKFPVIVDFGARKEVLPPARTSADDESRCQGYPGPGVELYDVIELRSLLGIVVLVAVHPVDSMRQVQPEIWNQLRLWASARDPSLPG